MEQPPEPEIILACPKCKSHQHLRYHVLVEQASDVAVAFRDVAGGPIVIEYTGDSTVFDELEHDVSDGMCWSCSNCHGMWTDDQLITTVEAQAWPSG